MHINDAFASFGMVKELVERVRASDDFKAITCDVVLCNIFYDTVQTTVGFYDKQKHEIYTFTLPDDGVVSLVDTSRPVHDQALPELVVTGNECMPDKALVLAKQVMQKEYSQEIPIKLFTVLQMSKEGAVWQCVGLTKALRSISVRVLANDGQILEHSCDTFARMDGNV